MNRTINKFSKLKSEAGGRKDSRAHRERFARLAQGEAEIADIGQVTRGFPPVGKLRPGMLIAFEYSAKYGDELPYWDRYPLVMVTKITRTGWYGINFHYIHPRVRASLLYTQDKSNINIIEQDIAVLSTKRYLAKQVVRRAREVPQEYMELVMQMPFENFQKSSKQKVWRDTSRKK